MILRIARKELVEMFRDGRFRVLAAVVLAVSIVSLIAGWRHYSDVNQQHEVAQAATREQWLRQPNKNPHSAAHYGVYAFKPKSQLAIVDTGIDPYMGVAVWLEAHKQNEFKYRPAQDRTAVQRFGEMTAAETLQVLMPLFIVLMTFSSFAGEREQGTLRQILSLGVSRRALALGKALGVATALGLILLPATIVGVMALVLTSDGGLLAGNPARAGWLTLAYIAYFAVVIAISLAVSARAGSSRLALVILLTFWFANGLVASRVISDLAAWLYPTPSAVEFQKALERDLNDQQEMERRLDRRKAELFQQYNVGTIDALPVAFSGISLQEGEEHGNEVFDYHYGRLFAIYERQNRVYQLGALAAPMLAVRSLSMALAGTDFQQHRHFIGAAEDYRRDIQRVMNHDIAVNQRKGEVYLAGRELWEKVPDFEYETPSTAWVLGHQRWSLLILALWVAGSVALMVRATRTASVE
jgi:ABC-2 type transport system permease protein